MVHVHRDKGAKDRYVPLPPDTLALLRRYWTTHRHPPWLFPATGRDQKHMTTATEPMSRSSVQGAFRKAQQRAGLIKRDVGIHTLRKVSPQTPGAPRPAYGHSKDGRDDLKQVLLSLGVSGDGGIPLRVGLRDGNRSDSVETPVAIAECLALGLEGVRGIVADSKAYSRRTLGLCLERGIDLVTLVPRTCAVRQELEAWGQQQSALPLLVEKPGRTKDEAPRRWHGQSVRRQVEVESSDGRVAGAVLRCVVVHASPLAQQQAQPSTAAPAQEAAAGMAHAQDVQAQWFACEADATAAIAEYEGQGQGRRGRHPRP